MRFQMLLSVEQKDVGDILAFLQKPGVNIIGIDAEEPPKKKKVPKKTAAKPAKKTLTRRKKSSDLSAVDVVRALAAERATFNTADVAKALGKNGYAPSGASPVISKSKKLGDIRVVEKGVFAAKVEA